MENTTQTLIGSGSLFLPEGISAATNSVDALFAFIFYLSLILFVGIIYVLFRFVRKYKATDTNTKAEKHITHNNTIEVIWTVIPTIIVLFIFYWGYTDFIKMKTPPGEAIEVHVVGKKWLWQFQYPNGKQTIGELVVPENTPVRLIMSSEDVIH
ncbi:MAG: cytochrome c oxidase subunit II, partial [bacterium]|nr:cytochrome c oxidase subunit II [bacterium]